VRWAKRLDPVSVDPYVAEAEVTASPEKHIAALRDAVAKEPRVAALHYLLGRAYLAAGRDDEARSALREAHRLNPRDDLIMEALRRAGM
jgi:cytochrome c-type biogenesis protein CcmH/NrfG